jgi:hypothetical protein
MFLQKGNEMILMPVWIFEETEEGYSAILGSEPKVSAEREWLPRDCVVSCVYAPGDGSPRFALVTLREIPEEVRKKNPNFYRNVAGN